MHPILKQEILDNTGASEIRKVELVQSLWSGFGAIERVYLDGSKRESIIIKRIQPPSKMKHPRGWNSDISANRKIRSYEIEKNWYKNYVSELPVEIKVPEFLFTFDCDEFTAVAMEDLKSSGYHLSFNPDSEDHFNASLLWLARFHAANLSKSHTDLWSVGTYWHLATRQEEFEKMIPGKLKDAAKEIDHRLNSCKFKTLVHGDAKPANFCFSQKGSAAAVDFQYIGGGSGIKDVMYLMSSVLSEEELFEKNQLIVARYFMFLEGAIEDFKLKEVNFSAVKQEWQELYLFAWADFIRFLEGWSPEHARRNAYTHHLLNDLIV
jgi:hypothetical protein